MQSWFSTLPKTLFLAILATGLLSIPATNAVDATSQSSCIVCHTDEDALTRTLSTVKPEKSAHTSGVG